MVKNTSDSSDYKIKKIIYKTSDYENFIDLDLYTESILQTIVIEYEINLTVIEKTEFFKTLCCINTIYYRIPRLCKNINIESNQIYNRYNNFEFAPTKRTKKYNFLKFFYTKFKQKRGKQKPYNYLICIKHWKLQNNKVWNKLNCCGIQSKDKIMNLKDFSNFSNEEPAFIQPNPAYRTKTKPIYSLLPPPSFDDIRKKCCIIDLDETLVHSSFRELTHYDFKITVELDTGYQDIYVCKRPYVDVFLEKVKTLFECVLFTASLSKYANPVVNLLDKKNAFRFRLFRESCVFYRGSFVKDMSMMGRPLKNVVIVDNSPMSFLFNATNAIQIISWFDDPTDRALLELIPYLERLSRSQSVIQFLKSEPPPISAAVPINVLSQLYNLPTQPQQLPILANQFSRSSVTPPPGSNQQLITSVQRNSTQQVLVGPNNTGSPSSSGSVGMPVIRYQQQQQQQQQQQHQQQQQPPPPPPAKESTESVRKSPNLFSGPGLRAIFSRNLSKNNEPTQPQVDPNRSQTPNNRRASPEGSKPALPTTLNTGGLHKDRRISQNSTQYAHQPNNQQSSLNKMNIVRQRLNSASIIPIRKYNVSQQTRLNQYSFPRSNNFIYKRPRRHSVQISFGSYL